MKNTIIAFLAICAASLTASALNYDELLDIKKQLVPDGRQVVLDFNFMPLHSGGVAVTGASSDANIHKAFIDSLKSRCGVVVDYIDEYPTDSMGLVSIPVASLRTRGAMSGEMATQAVMGMPVRLLELSNAGWWRVQTPDGYIAWVPESSLKTKTKEEFNAWRNNSQRFVVNNVWQTRAFSTPKAGGVRDVVTDLVLGAIVEKVPGSKITNGRMNILLPDGRTGWADAKDLTPIVQWADQQFDAQKILDTAYSLEGSPYLWGGTSIKSVDCSGLVKVSYLNNGYILRRDASQQCLTGEQLPADSYDTYEAADLLFFGNADTGRVTHVALYDHDGKYVHSSGRVKRNSLDRNDPAYLYSPIRAARMHGYEGTEGIVRAINHPWFF